MQCASKSGSEPSMGSSQAFRTPKMPPANRSSCQSFLITFCTTCEADWTVESSKGLPWIPRASQRACKPLSFVISSAVFSSWNIRATADTACYTGTTSCKLHRHCQGGRQYNLNGILPFVMTSCASPPCSATSGKIAAHHNKPTAGFPGSSNKQEGVLPGVKPNGRMFCPWPTRFAVHPGHCSSPP